jgi:hypothetical protein
MLEFLDALLRFMSAACALGAMIVGIRNTRRIREVHIMINSRMDQLLVASGLASRAEGVEQGRKEVANTPD